MDTVSFSLLCFSQGGRDEGNYLDDALMRQDAQVSRTAVSLFSFASKALVGGPPHIFHCILAKLGYVLFKKKKKKIPTDDL